MINSSIPAFNAQNLRDKFDGKDWINVNDEVYNVLSSSYPKKKEDIVNDVKAVLKKNKGNEVTYKVAESLVTQALKTLKKNGKAENTSHGMWKKI